MICSGWVCRACELVQAAAAVTAELYMAVLLQTNSTRRLVDTPYDLTHSPQPRRPQGTACGVMEAYNLPDCKAPIVTFWEADIIDNVHHTFFTNRWGQHGLVLSAVCHCRCEQGQLR